MAWEKPGEISSGHAKPSLPGNTQTELCFKLRHTDLELRRGPGWKQKLGGYLDGDFNRGHGSAFKSPGRQQSGTPKVTHHVSDT